MKSTKGRYILGALTIGAIVGVTVYAIKKSKDAAKAEEESISLAEAREIVAQRQAETGETDEFNNEEDEEEEENESYSEGHMNASVEEVEVIVEERRIIAVPFAAAREEEEDVIDVDGVEVEYEELEHDPLADFMEDHPRTSTEIPPRPTYTVEPLNDFYYIEEGIDPKEDKTLRHNPNSVEAKHQYIRMELADWEPNHDVYRFLIQLFEFPFVPQNDGDELLRTQIIDHKVQFFGWNSKWNREVSFADVIFHYARRASYDCGETVQYWVEYFLDFIEWDWDTTSAQIDSLLQKLQSHTYFFEHKQTFGLFGLSREYMDNAHRIAANNFDNSVTFEIEYNEFLKSCFM